MEQRYSDNEISKRDIPSFIEPRPPLISNPYMRPRPEKGTNLMELFEEDSEVEEPELVQVYLRMKPCEVRNNLYEVRSDKCLVTSLDTTTAGHGRRTQHNVSRMYTFSRIFNAECGQKEIFEQVVRDNLKKLPDGHSFTLLTYGASGSGKTYTLMGTVNSPGLIPRSLEYVFKMVDASQQPLYKPSDGGADKLGYTQQEFELQWVKRLRQVSAPQRDKYRRMSAQLKSDLTVSSIDLANRTKHYVWVSFVEIYNEAIYDLLAPPDKRTKLRIREDTTGQVYAKGVTQAFVRTGVEAYDVLVAGKHNLVVAATGVHAHSSRSHCIFTITMLTEADGEIRTSCVRLCDLAGCERARATRNTGARMQESRAINSSLHVLERCLHMLRRNQKQRQEALVPYRESKLTRLLGSGLSGSRGEAVSMVVTLNPAPQYAYETKHVLSLAAVAQDIQINNTAMFASTWSTLESSTQDTTIASNAEVMKLRSDNELLHFELVQAQARNKELLAAMEQTQEESATTMRELVEEAKDMTRQYYESQIAALRSEMKDMKDEYEARLSEAAPTASTATPNKYLRAKVEQLMTEIAVLEDELSAERLARERAEEEAKHLRTCIDERDEKTYKETVPVNQDDVVLTDSDDESSDPLNQSLEPVFRTECLNQSRALHTDNEIKNILKDDTEQAVIIEEENSDTDKSTDSIKQVDDTPKNSDYETGDESEIINRKSMDDPADNFTNTIDDEERNHSTDMISRNVERKFVDLSYTEPKIADELDDANKSGVRATYFVSDIEQDNGPNESVEIKSQVRGTYFVEPSVFNSSNDEEINGANEQESEISGSEKARRTYFVTQSAIDVSNDEEIESPQNVLKTSEIDKARGTYFVKKSAVEFSSDEDIENAVENDAEIRKTYFVRKSAIDTSIDEEMQEGIEPKTLPQENVPEQKEPEVGVKNLKSEMLVNRIIQSLKKSTRSNNSDSSLRQFEQLELASKECEADPHYQHTAFENINIFKEKNKRTYFDESAKTVLEQIHVNTNTSYDSETVISSNKTKDSNDEKFYEKQKLSNVAPSWNNLERNIDGGEYKGNLHEVPLSKPATENKVYFDKIEGETIPNIIITTIKSSASKNHERSPSIVSDDAQPFEPSTMKKLLGENIAKLEVLSSIHKNNVLKKHESIDVFDGLESPLVKDKDVNAAPVRKVSNVDEVRKSIERLVLEQKSRHDNKQEAKSESNTSLGKKEDPITVNKPQFLEPVAIKKDKRNVVVADVQADMELNETQYRQDNTIEEFENIYKDLSTQRATEFDLLTVTQEIDKSNIKDYSKTEIETESHKVEQIKTDQNKQVKNDEAVLGNKEEVKYNLRHKGKSISKESDKKNEQETDEILLESIAKCESKTKLNKRSLRLRRRKNQDEEYSDQDSAKLKDILNLKKEFCDVTLDLPAVKKKVKDIPSPEKLPGEENLPPMGIQSCPSKSVTRSRRKLFTPRAEPLEESFSQPGDSNERVYVPRPSYHRARARRKL